MKRVLLRTLGKPPQEYSTRKVIETLLEQPPPGTGVSYGEMRRRDRLFDALDKADKRYVDLEDADHALLKGLLEAFPFGICKRELRSILDDIAEAKSPEETTV